MSHDKSPMPAEILTGKFHVAKNNRYKHMKAVLTYFFLLVLNCFGNSAFSQYRDLSFNHLSVNNGLSQGVNNCIFSDSKGYTWISSFDGLNRFDGIDCVIYREVPGDSTSPKGTLFLNILEDKNNNLWIGSNEGLNFYDRKQNSFTCFYIPDGRSVNQTFSPFYIDNSNNIWLQAGKDILYFNTATKKFRTLYHFNFSGNLIVNTLPAVQLEPLQTVTVAARGGTEIYTANANMQQLNFTALDMKGAQAVLAINTICTEAGNIWIGSNNGLFIFSGNELKPVSLKSINNNTPRILALHIDKKQTLWIGSEKDGLFYLNKEKQKQYVNAIYNPYSLSGNQVQYIYTDRENNLWVAAWGKGINYVSLEKFRFQHYLTKQETSQLEQDNFIRSIVEIRPGRLWCGTQSNSILELDENKKISKKISNGLPPAIEHIYKDKNGMVWIATFSGLYFADPALKNILRFSSSNAFPANDKQFNYIYGLQNGDLLASSNAGLFLIKTSNKQKTVSGVKGVSQNDVYLTSFQSTNGDIYVCRAFKGFSVYQQLNDSFVLKKDFFDQSTVKCFAVTDDTTLWIGTTKGLIKFNKATLSVLKNYTTADGLANQYIYGILVDKNDLWLSTNAGISRFNTTSRSFKNFTSDDGLQSNEFNTYSFCKTANGEFVFGGVNGINAFYPSQLKTDQVVPALLLQQVRINDTAAVSLHNPADLQRINLPYNQNTVSFQFAVIDYNNPRGCKYLYKLAGYDKDWILSGNKSMIRYANLPSGNYVLNVKAVNAEGIASEKIYTLDIAVQTPWYQTWWFRTLVILLTGILVWYLIKNYYSKKLEKQRQELEKQHAVEQERTRMARELHDGLGSMLSGIKHSFSALNNEMDLGPQQQVKFNSNIENLNETISELRNISHSLASDGLLKHGLETTLKDYCINISRTGTLNIAFKAIDTENMLLTENQAFNIFRIVQELLQNIIKHAGAKQVIVQLSYNARMIYLAVEDDGHGFSEDAASQGKGMGLKNIETRVQLLNGQLDIKSEKSNGTSVLIEIPCN